MDGRDRGTINRRLDSVEAGNLLDRVDRLAVARVIAGCRLAVPIGLLPFLFLLQIERARPIRDMQDRIGSLLLELDLTRDLKIHSRGEIRILVENLLNDIALEEMCGMRRHERFKCLLVFPLNDKLEEFVEVTALPGRRIFLPNFLHQLVILVNQADSQGT